MSESKSTPKRVFTDEFKREAVRLVHERGNVCAVARDLGIHESILGRWKRAVHKESQVPPTRVESRSLPAFPGKGKPRDEEIVQLQRENRRLKEEVDILKKAV